MKKRFIVTATILSILLALLIVMPSSVAIAVEVGTPVDPPLPTPPTVDRPIILASSTISNTNPGRETIHLYLTLVNVSEDIFLESLRITVTGFRSSAIMLAEGASFSREIPTTWLEPGYQATIMLPIVVSPDLETSSQLSVVISGSVVGGDEIHYTETAEIILARPEPPPDEPPADPIPPSVPRVIISRQQMNVENVIAGAPFDLTITLQNTSRNRNVRNMVVTITDAEGVFVPVVGVNSFFIERLDAQETTDVVISLLARQDTETGSHPITVTINYEDTLNAPHSTAPTINIPVYMPVRLETSNLSFEDEGGGSAFLSFQIINFSRASLYNVGVRLEGNFMAEQFQEFHFGTINAGAFDFFEDTIFPFEFGEVSGEIVLVFEDSSGAPGEIRIPISTWVGEPFFPEFPEGEDRWPPEGDFDWEEGFEENGSPWWLIWAIIGGGVLIAGVITLIVVKRRKRKKKEAEDFDDM